MEAKVSVLMDVSPFLMTQDGAGVGERRGSGDTHLYSCPGNIEMLGEAYLPTWWFSKCSINPHRGTQQFPSPLHL